jgi:hypothetical protein
LKINKEIKNFKARVNNVLAWQAKKVSRNNMGCSEWTRLTVHWTIEPQMNRIRNNSSLQVTLFRQINYKIIKIWIFVFFFHLFYNNKCPGGWSKWGTKVVGGPPPSISVEDAVEPAPSLRHSWRAAVMWKKELFIKFLATSISKEVKEVV